MDAVAKTQPLEHVEQMIFDSALGDIEPQCDFLVGEPVGNEP
jgi:hypothetical protein